MQHKPYTVFVTVCRELLSCMFILENTCLHCEFLLVKTFGNYPETHFSAVISFLVPFHEIQTSKRRCKLALSRSWESKKSQSAYTASQILHICIFSTDNMVADRSRVCWLWANSDLATEGISQCKHGQKCDCQTCFMDVSLKFKAEAMFIWVQRNQQQHLMVHRMVMS